MKLFKKITIISVILAVFAICAISVGAKWWEDNPFEDVKSDAWYYDAVRICRENEIFYGVSENEFNVNGMMTRAMATQALASASGFDKAEYDRVYFSDVPAGKWYTASVCWAYENKITTGTGNNCFSPDKVITREELVSLLRGYAAFCGYPTDSGEGDITAFPDAGEVSSWATENMKWAYNNKIISGTVIGGVTYLSPKTTATRTQVAVMMVNLLNTKPIREINGNDISGYRIVYSASEYDSLKNSERLAGYLKNSLGLDLEVVTDESEPVDKEIIVGRTNREDRGLVTIDRSAFSSDQEFICTVQGDRLIICGIDTDSHDDTGGRTTHNVRGTRNAVFYFGEEYLGVETYSESNGGIFKYNPDPILSFEDGFVYKDAPAMRARIFYMSGGILGTGTYYSHDTYNVAILVSGDFENESKYYHAATPCMSSEENIQSVIENVRKVLLKTPHRNCLGIGICDSDQYCTCENCRALYKKHGSLSATLCLLLNRVSDALADEFPNVKYDFGAYTYVIKPPKGIVLNDNIIVEYYSINACYNHAYNDESCPINASIRKEVEGWNAISNELWFWDHCCNFETSLCPVPDWDSMLTNIRFFAEAGATQVLMNSLLDSGYRYPDFCYFRGYMLSAIYRNPYMSEEEFNYRMNKGLEAYYGKGWRNIRKYLDLLCEMSDSKHHNMFSAPEEYYDMEMVADKAEYIDSLWEDTLLKAADDAEMAKRIVLAQHSWIFLRQTAINERVVNYGSEEEKQAYAAANYELLTFIEENKISWSEDEKNKLDNYGDFIKPSKW